MKGSDRKSLVLVVSVVRSRSFLEKGIKRGRQEGSPREFVQTRVWARGAQTLVLTNPLDEPS